MLERCCDDREHAERNREFVYLRDYDGWCFVDGPRRSMTGKASYLLNERGGMQHIGEFYSWESCPFCGADLPRPDDPESWTPSGEEGG
jgi:hypothetical protein